MSVDRKLFGTSTIGPHPVRTAPAVAPHGPRCSADACRSAIGRPILPAAYRDPNQNYENRNYIRQHNPELTSWHWRAEFGRFRQSPRTQSGLVFGKVPLPDVRVVADKMPDDLAVVGLRHLVPKASREPASQGILIIDRPLPTRPPRRPGIRSSPRSQEAATSRRLRTSTGPNLCIGCHSNTIPHAATITGAAAFPPPSFAGRRSR